VNAYRFGPGSTLIRLSPRRLAVVAAGLLAAMAAAQDDDVVLRALTDEMTRSMARLQLDGKHAPYLVRYDVVETQGATVSGTFGAIADDGETRRRSLAVEVRVGDYTLDNTNFAGGDFGYHSFGGGHAGFPLEDDYDAMRQALWLATDGEFHRAVETLEKKKAYLEQKTIKDRPHDLARAEPVVALLPVSKLQFDRARWREVVRRVCAVFREHEAVQASRVWVTAEVRNRWLVNSEGFRIRRSTPHFAVVMTARGQADDGMHVSDGESFAAESEAGLPKEDDLLAAARALALKVAQLRDAARAEDYRGPVLFEGRAAAQLFAQVLAPNLSNPVEPIGDTFGGGGNPLKEKIGKRVVARTLSILDDPARREFQGQPVLGHYSHDEDGVPAQALTLVENGVLKTFCSDRTPSRQVKASNGHRLDGNACVSTLLVETREPQPLAELRSELVRLGEDEDLEHVLVVRQLADGAAGGSGLQMMLLMGMGRGEASLSPPVRACLVSVKDGSERPVRGASFGEVSLRALRDIVMAGDDQRAHHVQLGFGEVHTIITPSIVVKEMGLNKAPEESDKPPRLTNAFFAK